MTVKCEGCRRPQPADAAYCYFDGISIDAAVEGPRNIAQMPFPAPFRFPTGETCANFDQLALVCQTRADGVWKLLRSGAMGRFLSGTGRPDLAEVAKQAAALEDADQAVAYLQSRLPQKNLMAPRLRVQPEALKLGELKHGQPTAVEVRLVNAGHRLLMGHVSAESTWIKIDDRPAGEPRVVQFWDEQKITIRVDWPALAASLKPQETKLCIETNGGLVEVPVSCFVPIVPFPVAPLAGCRTPRELVTAMRRHPREAAQLYDSGAIADWYRENGWPFPVKEAAASGLAGLDQFFQALGLLQPPVVILDTPALTFTGPAGTRQRQVIHLHTKEDRPLFGSARSTNKNVAIIRCAAQGKRLEIEVEALLPLEADGPLGSCVEIETNSRQPLFVPVRLIVARADAGAVAQAQPGESELPAIVLTPLPPLPPLPAGPALSVWTRMKLALVLAALVALGSVGIASIAACCLAERLGRRASRRKALGLLPTAPPAQEPGARLSIGTKLELAGGLAVLVALGSVGVFVVAGWLLIKTVIRRPLRPRARRAPTRAKAEAPRSPIADAVTV